MVVFSNVKLVKFPELDEVDEKLFEESLARFFKKVGNDSLLQLSLKEYKKGGLRAQHELHAKLVVGQNTFFAEDTGWLLMEVIQGTLKVLEKEVKKKDERSK